MLNVEYQEEESLFRYWLSVHQFKKINIEILIDINDWCDQTYGAHYGKWHYKCEDTDIAIMLVGSQEFKLPGHKYFWMFKEKSDAMLFKLTWGGKNMEPDK